MLTLKKPIEFEWDQGNIHKNSTKHGVTPNQSEEPFVDPRLIILPDPQHSNQEKRYLGLGVTKDHHLLLLVFAQRGTKIRIISARRANHKERIVYDQHQKT